MRRSLILVFALASVSAFATKPSTPQSVSPDTWSRADVTLQGSAFMDMDPGDTQGGAFFELRFDGGTWGDATSLDSGVIGPTQSWRVPGFLNDGDQACFHLRYFDDGGTGSDLSTEKCFTVDDVPPTSPGLPTVTLLGGAAVQFDFVDSTDQRSGIGAILPAYEYEDGGLFFTNVGGSAGSPLVDAVGPGTWRAAIVPIDKAGNFGAASPPSAPFTIADDPSLPVPAAPSLQFCPTNNRQNHLLIPPTQSGDTFVVQWSEADAGVWHYQFRVGGSYGFYWQGPEGYAQTRTALIRDGGTSDWSAPSAPCVIDFTAPSIPAGLQANATGSSVSLTWSASTDALSGVAGYDLERAVAMGGAYTTFGAPMATTATDDPGPGTWAYRVRARDLARNTSDWSALATVTITAPLVDGGMADAGVGDDGGSLPDDAGAGTSDGGRPARGDLLVGCGCSSDAGTLDAVLAAFLVIIAAASRIRREAARRSSSRR